MKKKLYLHIGQYKTGSTALQEFLTTNRHTLLQKGVLYPSSLVRGSAHFLLDDLLRSEFRCKTNHVDLNDFLGELASTQHESLIISCEALSGDLSNLNHEQTTYIWKRLIEIFKNYTIYPIVYIRRQDDAIESRIIQSIKGHAHATNVDIDSYLQDDSALNYCYFLSKLGEVFGKESIILRIYNRSLFIDGDIAKDFIGICSIAPDSLIFLTDTHNPSPGGRHLQFIRYLNTYTLPDSLKGKLRRLAWSIYKTREDAGGAKVLDYAARRRIMNFFFESNVELMGKYGINALATYAREFFADSKSNEPNCRITESDVFDVLLAYISQDPNINSQSSEVDS